ncbi:MAG: STAS/SEC14 domain-containing protein [Myxococcales bacterium]|nr:STAS/SEC14 domain-containing protein [Myxococcales bacterium]
MLELIEGLPASIIAVEASGTVSKDDYQRVLEPVIEQARHDGRRIRFLYQLGPRFEGFSAGGAWEDARVGLGAMRLFDGCAVVTDVGWIEHSVGMARMLMPCPMRVFANEARAEAVRWLESLPASDLALHMHGDVGVLVAEPKGPLRAEDFDAMALVVDPWIASHGKLAGLVIHTADFPGWADLASLFRHIKFVKGHHRQLGRVALAADSKLADLGPALAEHFVAAEIRHFGYGELDAAIAWAGGGS